MALGKKTGAGSKMNDTIKRLDGLRKDVTKPVTFRMEYRAAQLLEEYAHQQGMRPATLMKSWIIQRMREEGILT